METKHTPGPWGIIKCGCGDAVCNQYRISTQCSVGFDKPDAVLIAAAPTLLDALDRLTEAFPELGTDAPLNGADAVDRLAELWPVIQAARERARGT